MVFCQLDSEIKQKSEEESSDNLDSLEEPNVMSSEDVKGEKGGVYDHQMMDKPMNLPKRRRVYAVRDFPDAFLKLNGERSFAEKAMVPFDAALNDNQNEDVDSDLEDDKEPFENDVEVLRRPAHMEFDNFSHNLEVEWKAPFSIRPDEDEEGALQWDTESFIPLSMVECEDSEIIGQTKDDDSFIGKFDPWLRLNNVVADGANVCVEDETTTSNMYSEIVPKICKVIGGFENSLLKPNNMVADGAYVKVEEGEPSTHNLYSGMLPKRHKVFAVRDFPDAFIRLNEGSGEPNGSLVYVGAAENLCADKDSACISDDEEEPFENDLMPMRDVCNTENVDWRNFLPESDTEEALEAGYINQSRIQEHEVIQQQDIGVTTLLVSKPITPKASLAKGQGSGTKSIQGSRLGSEEVEHRVIVQALMAATRCPWRSKTTGRSKKRNASNRGC